MFGDVPGRMNELRAVDQVPLLDVRPAGRMGPACTNACCPGRDPLAGANTVSVVVETWAVMAMDRMLTVSNGEFGVVRKLAPAAKAVRLTLMKSSKPDSGVGRLSLGCVVRRVAIVRHCSRCDSLIVPDHARAMSRMWLRVVCWRVLDGFAGVTLARV